MKPHAEKQPVLVQKLQCDNCFHQEPVEKFSAELIGKECPVCQSNMLTERDYRVAKWQLRLLKVLTWLSRVALWINPKAKTGVLSVHVKDGDTISDFREDGVL